MTMNTLEAHRQFLNRYYGVSRWFYDITRKYYLFGRDRALVRLLDQPWDTLVEVGPGTGRNLRKLRKSRPSAHLGGIDASDAMLAYAAQRAPWARLVQGFAESANYSLVHGRRPQRILFSYCLSMVGDARGALDHARCSLAPGGSVLVVDFADFAGAPRALSQSFRLWLEAFHVTPLNVAWLEDAADFVELGPSRYFAIAQFGALPA